MTTALDRARRYLVAVDPLGLPGEPEHQHLAVLAWEPRIDAWVHGPAICGRSVAQGPVEPSGACCPDCQAHVADYTLILGRTDASGPRRRSEGCQES